MRINPIVKKDIKVQARSMRICWEVFAYEAILALVFFLAMFIIEEQNWYSDTNIYSDIVNLYPVLAVTQIIILGVVVPIRTASAISGEKERQTFDIMMTSSMTVFSIVLGKIGTAIVQGMFYVVAGLPIVALAFVIGGLSWSNLFAFLGVSFFVALFSAAVGIFCSSVCRKTISAVILSYGIYVVFFLGTLVPYLISAVTGTDTGLMITTFLLLLNPIVYLLEFFSWSMTGMSPAQDLWAYGKNVSIDAVVAHYGWMAASTVLLLLVVLVLIIFTMRRIRPISKRTARKLAEGTRHGR